MIHLEFYCFSSRCFTDTQAWQEPALLFIYATSVFLVGVRSRKGMVNVWMSVEIYMRVK
jgi:hypothetical protein